jgi:hypothetical protein
MAPPGHRDITGVTTCHDVNGLEARSRAALPTAAAHAPAGRAGDRGASAFLAWVGRRILFLTLADREQRALSVERDLLGTPIHLVLWFFRTTELREDDRVAKSFAVRREASVESTDLFVVPVPAMTDRLLTPPQNPEEKISCTSDGLSIRTPKCFMPPCVQSPG